MEGWPQKPSNFFFEVTNHDGIFFQIPIPIPLPTLRGIHVACAFEGWHGLGENKMNDDEHKEVLADGEPIASRTHEPKVLIVPHWNVLPPPWIINALVPLLILGSSNKLQFAAGAVVAPKGPVAISIFKPIGVNFACASPVPMPLLSLSVNSSTVVVGFTWGDIAAGVVCMLLDMLKARLEEMIFGWAFKKFFPRGLLRGPMNALFRRANLDDLFARAGFKNYFQGLRSQVGRAAGEARVGQMIDAIAEHLKDANLLDDATQAALDAARSRFFTSGGADAAALFGRQLPNIFGDGAAQGLFAYGWGRVVGGDWGDWGPNPVLNSNPLTGLITGETWSGTGQAADTLGALIDGRSTMIQGFFTPDGVPIDGGE
ncbi:MAG TPA: hypothetical protein VLS89_04565 [Candidatus Nanopelagicales bacterium]|nr:hypothetical protein [Candidatus Nanopelagicales bacterium]